MSKKSWNQLKHRIQSDPSTPRCGRCGGWLLPGSTNVLCGRCRKAEADEEAEAEAIKGWWLIGGIIILLLVVWLAGRFGQ